MEVETLGLCIKVTHTTFIIIIITKSTKYYMASSMPGMLVSSLLLLDLRLPRLMQHFSFIIEVVVFLLVYVDDIIVVISSRKDVADQVETLEV